MLSDEQRAIITATVPALRAHGETITRVFYRQMLGDHPELLNYFNPANQRGDGAQARSLAASVLTYAEHINRLDRLGGMVERIATKHVSLEIKGEQYPIVGKYLLGAITEVLGEAATPAILDAWAAAYGQLADIMIGREAALYTEAATQPNGWAGFKPFRVTRRVTESEVMASFHLVPADGSAPPAFRPGQYVSVRVRPPYHPHEQIRQYSLSAAPDGVSYRISVKREDAPADVPDAPAGLVSTFLHAAIGAGDMLDIHTPLGDFVLDDVSEDPVVLISGGAGITAVLSMLEHIVTRTNRPVVFLHGARGRAYHAFGERVRELATMRAGVRVRIFYEEESRGDRPGVDHDQVSRITAGAIRANLPAGDAAFYYCGPIGFMTATEAALDSLGVPVNRRHSEAFAPDPSFAIAAE